LETTIEPIGINRIEDVVAALKVRYDGPTKTVEDYTYIPWEQSVYQLDRVFGAFGWSLEPAAQFNDPASGIYTRTVTLTVSAVHPQLGIVSATRTGEGRAVARASRDELENRRSINPADTRQVSDNLKIHDTAIAAAASDALSRAAKLCGDALGLFLYAEKFKAQGKSSDSSSSVSRSNVPYSTQTTHGDDGGRELSEGMVKMLGYLKVPSGVVSTLQRERRFNDTRKIIDSIKNGGKSVDEALADAGFTPATAPAGDDFPLPQRF
jgi:hypothetical protein